MRKLCAGSIGENCGPCFTVPIDRSMEQITDDQFDALLAWVRRERAIERLMYRGKLGFGELLLRRQMNYDRLLRESAPGRT